MNIDLSGKKALVGGSTSGIGKAIALQLAASGASVTLMSRYKEKLETVKEQLPLIIMTFLSNHCLKAMSHKEE